MFYIFGQFRTDCYFFTCQRFIERQLSAVERLSCYIFTSAAVKVVACKGMTDISEMHTYLMSSARFKMYLRKGVFSAVCHALIMSNCLLSVLTHTADNYGFTLTGNGSVYSAAFGDLPGYCGIVDLFAFALQKICRKCIFSNDAKPRSVTVEAVHCTKSQFGEHRRKFVSEGVALMLDGRMHGHSRRLVENYDTFAFVSHINIKIGIRFKETVVAESQDYLIPFFNNVDASYQFSVTGDSAVDAFKPC